MDPIVVGVDGSPPALKAARLAVQLAAPGTPLTLVYVVPPIAAGAEWMMVPPEVFTQLRRNGEAELRRVADVIKRPDAEQLVLQGTPAELLVQTAEERRASMLVVGNHGRGAVARLLLGSVADRVAHLAHCPVLIVR